MYFRTFHDPDKQNHQDTSKSPQQAVAHGQAEEPVQTDKVNDHKRPDKQTSNGARHTSGVKGTQAGMIITALGGLASLVSAGAAPATRRRDNIIYIGSVEDRSKIGQKGYPLNGHYVQTADIDASCLTHPIAAGEGFT